MSTFMLVNDVYCFVVVVSSTIYLTVNTNERFFIKYTTLYMEKNINCAIKMQQTRQAHGHIRGF